MSGNWLKNNVSTSTGAYDQNQVSDAGSSLKNTGLYQSLFGNQQAWSTQSTAPNTPEEERLIQLNTDLAKKQLENIDQMQPFQREMLLQSVSDLRKQGQLDNSFDKYLTPDMQAQFAQQDFQRAGNLGADQGALSDSLTQQLLAGGTANPAQMKAIQDAADAAISSGSSDIDISTQRGVSQIADELANQRGMRLSDTPIMREAALLERAGGDQKASLIKNVRANQANNVLQYPLTSLQTVGGINLSQQDKATAATQFQAQLRQLAQQNRLSMYGTTSGSGIGLANVGAGAGSSALGSLANVQTHNTSSTGFNPAANMSGAGSYLNGLGGFLGGAGKMMAA